MTKAIGQLNHFGPVTDDFDRTCFLYEKVLKLEPIPVPATGHNFRVAWYTDDRGNEVHVAEKDPDFAKKTGVRFNRTLFHHVAYEVEDFEKTKEALDESGFEYYETEGEGVLSRRQLYVVEPSGLTLELFIERNGD